MDLTLSDEQTMLRDSAARFVCDGIAAGEHDDRASWAQFAELGWLALPLPDTHGGLGGSVLDAAVLLEEFGRGPLVTPYVSTVILCAGMIAALGDDGQRCKILPAVAEGRTRLAFGHSEPGPRGRTQELTAQATASANGWSLTGTKIAVLDAAAADTLLVSAQCDRQTAVFVVPRDAEGLSCSTYPVLGGGGGATVVFDNVALPGDARLAKGDAAAAIAAAIDSAIAVLCAEAVGMMAALLDATVSYTNMRQQFGKPLNANQAVRFKLADMAVALEEARSLALRAALMIDAPVNERIRAAAGAKSGVGRRARLVAEIAIQLHGAMGVTEELTIGTYYKRVLAFEAMFGGSDAQLVRHAQASGRLAMAEAA